MTYRGFPYFTAQNSGPANKFDLTVSKRRRLSNCSYGVRRAAPPRPPAPHIEPCAQSASVKPARPSIQRPLFKSNSKNAESMLPLSSFVVTVVVLVALAFTGVFAFQVFTGFFDGTSQAIGAVKESGSEDESASTPVADWRQGTIPSLYQTDPQWSGHSYGSDTIGAAGSAPLCLTMVRISLTGDASVGPPESADLVQQGNYAGPENSETLLSEGSGLLGLSAHDVDGNERAIRRELAAGRPVIASVSSDAFGSDDDHIVLVGIDEHSLLEIRDPQSIERTAKHWKFDEIISAASSFHSYSIAL